MRSAALLLLFLLPGVISRGQSPYTLGSVGLLPARAYVGDTVQMHVRVSLEAGAMLVPPSDLPFSARLEIETVVCKRMREGEWEVQIHYTSFEPGARQLPALNLGAIELSGLDIVTRSVIEDRGETGLRSPKPQLAIPGTWTKIGFAVFSLLFCGPVLLFLLRCTPGWLARARKVQRRILPVLRMKFVLRRLGKRLPGMDGQRFFFYLTRAFRRYFSARLDFSAMTATTREIGRALPEKLSDGESGGAPLAAEIESLFREADEVKFGGRSCRKERLRLVLAQSERLVDAIERGAERVES